MQDLIVPWESREDLQISFQAELRKFRDVVSFSRPSPKSLIASQYRFPLPCLMPCFWNRTDIENEMLCRWRMR